MSKLVKLGKKFSAARKEFYGEIANTITNAPPMGAPEFWTRIEDLAREIHSMGKLGKLGRSAVKRGVHNWYIRITLDTDLDQWYAAARFVSKYREIKESLYKACWDLPKEGGAYKGDDSYGDWIDALPLAGKEVINRLLSQSAKLDYAGIDAAIHAAYGGEMRDLVMEGENYIESTIREKLEEMFPHIARNTPDDVAFPPPVEREYAVTWKIDIRATSVADAARQAREIQLDHGSIANVFEVSCEGKEPVEVDLDGNEKP